MEKQLKKKTREAGRLVLDITGAILGYTSAADKVLAKLEDEVEAKKLETSMAYQTLKTAKVGLQRTLEEMNEVLNKMME